MTAFAIRLFTLYPKHFINDIQSNTQDWSVITLWLKIFLYIRYINFSNNYLHEIILLTR